MRFFSSVVALAGAALLAAVLLGYGAPLVYELDLLAHFRLHLLGLSGIVALAALASRSRVGLWRALAAAILAVAGVGPLWEGPGAAGAGLPVTVMTANVYSLNPEPRRMLEALAEAGADILLTVETPRQAVEEDSPLRAIYPHVDCNGHDSHLMAVIWSKFPVVSCKPLAPESGLPAGVSAVVEIAPGRTVSVLGLHLEHVLLGGQGRQVESLDEITAGLPRPLVVMGDLNATAWSWGVHRAEVLTGTRRVGGVIRTWDGSYPTPLRALPEPFGLPIDHIMVSDGIGVAGIGTIDIPGSDHDAVRAALRVPACLPSAAAEDCYIIGRTGDGGGTCGSGFCRRAR